VVVQPARQELKADQQPSLQLVAAVAHRSRQAGQAPASQTQPGTGGWVAAGARAAAAGGRALWAAPPRGGGRGARPAARRRARAAGEAGVEGRPAAVAAARRGGGTPVATGGAGARFADAAGNRRVAARDGRRAGVGRAGVVVVAVERRAADALPAGTSVAGGA